MNKDNDLPILPDGEEISLMEKANRIKKYILDPSLDYPPPRFAFSKNGVPFCPLGDIQAVKAPPKNCKTFYLALLMIVALRGEYAGIKSLIKDAVCLYIDTEQHPRTTNLIYKRICKIAGIDGKSKHDQLKMLHTRGANPNEQIQVMKDAIELFNPQFVFIDGLRDFVCDFNDPAESIMLISEIMRIAMERDCLIINVVHTNPKDEKMRGHLGTELANKASDVFLCTKSKSADGLAIIKVAQTETRNADIDEINFAIDDVPDGNETIAVPIPVPLSQKERAELENMFKEALSCGNLKKADLKDKIQEKQPKMKSKEIYRLIDRAKENDIIDIDKVFGRYFFSTRAKPNVS